MATSLGRRQLRAAPADPGGGGDAPTTTTSTSSTPTTTAKTYVVSEEKVKEGYTKTLGTGDKFKITIDDEEHKVTLESKTATTVRIKVESEIQAGELVAVMTLKNELVSMGLTEFASKDLVNKDRGIAVKSSQVFMKPGIYPKIGVKK